MSVKVVCHTNIDSFKHVQWPTLLAGIPHLGDQVRALEPACIRVKNWMTGELRNVTIAEPTLEVVGVVHVGHRAYGPVATDPYVLVELHSRHATEMGWLY